MNNIEFLRVFQLLSDKLKNLSEQEIKTLSETAFYQNLWFSEKSIRSSIAGIIQLLEPTYLEKWLNNYSFENINPKKIGVIMAGNIPFVGFHDALCVICSGHNLFVKLSSNDKILPTYILDLLTKIEPKLKEKIIFTEKFNEIDALIATGSNNSARYFEYYFSKIPRIIRKSRTSLAILDGNETGLELEKLGKDIFTYFGHGCRNVSSILVPRGYSFNLFFESMMPFGNEMLNNNKYCNNYDYHKAIYLMNVDTFLDNNFLMIRESDQIYSPISVVHFHYYDNQNDILDYINSNKEKIQCIVSKNGDNQTQIKFGEAQKPSIFDYADGIDVMKFLMNL